MRLILTIIIPFHLATTALAGVPQVCKDYFERDSFADNDLHHGKSEVVALLSELSYELREPLTLEIEDDLVLDLFDLAYMEGVIDAQEARIVYEQVLSDFSDGEITEESALRLPETIHDSVIINFSQGDVNRVLAHLGPDHPMFDRIKAVTDCYFATDAVMAKDYRQLYEELAEHLRN